MSLLGLPTEVLDGIIELTILFGNDFAFESTLLSCTRLYDVGKSHIKRYQALRQYRRVEVGAEPEQRQWSDLFLAISQDPTIASYVTDLDLTDSQNSSERRHQASESPFDGVTELLRDLVDQSSWLADAGVDKDEWKKRVLDDRDTRVCDLFRTVLLLTLLPELRSLTLPEGWSGLTDDASGCVPVLNALAEHANTSIPPPNLPLGKLERLRPYIEPDYDPNPRGGFDVVSPFMAIPSFQELHISDLIAVDDGYTGIPFKWQYPMLNSKLVTMRLEGCCIDHTGITELLLRTPLIRTLHYSHMTKWHGCEHDWDAGAFVEAVAKQVGDRMLNLSVTLDQLFGSVETGVVSLEKFKVLENIELDLRCLAAPSPETGLKLGDGLHSGKWSVDQIPSLSQMLPTSIKMVILVTHEMEYIHALEVLQQLFKEPEQLKSSPRFQALQKLSLKHKTETQYWNKTLEDANCSDEDAENRLAHSVEQLLQTAGVQYSQ